ncbi:MAG: glycosyl hydrolase family 18 protein [Chloroflexi bacterium]|nr:glycosyl hydrolase family 18 protein [Chloroflexota bacterium]
MLKKLFLVVICAAGVFLVSLVFCECIFRFHVPEIYSEGGNALWLKHSWVGDRHTPDEYRSLAARLKKMKITDAYFHSGPFNGNGTVNRDRFSNAPELIKNMKKLAPDIRLQAWLGQIEAKAGGPLDLSSPATRKNIIDTSCKFMDMGFDGIHYDIEPIYSGDGDFLSLLKDTRKSTKSRGKVLSVAAHKPEPVPNIESILRKFISYTGYWKRSYFLDVARETDQVAVMSYDSGAPVPFLYGNLVSWITEWSVKNGVQNLYVGVPSYDEITGGHNPRVENVGNALMGLKKGASKLKPGDRKKVGSAIYADWTTSDEELGIYMKEWIGNQ